MKPPGVADLLGRVEFVVVPPWNTDTAAYDRLIQSVGAQLHCIVAIANNGHYSDCRAWAPKRARWECDLRRLVERDLNTAVSVVLPLHGLRHARLNPRGELSKKGARKDPLSPDDSFPMPPYWPNSRRE